MVKIYCNRCNKELDRDNKIGYIALNYRQSYRGDFVGDNQYEDMDFCTECMDALKAFLAGTPAEHPAKHEESTETSLKQVKTASKQTETVPNQPQELFRAPKDGKLQPEVKKTRQRIDYGKIMALHNAGWSNQKIADEMGMTYGAVATAISTYKKKVGGGKA